MNEIIQLNSVDVYNKMYGLKTLHPLVSVVDLRKATRVVNHVKMNYGVYALFLKNGTNCTLKYGRRYYDYQEGTIVSFAPGQLVGVDSDEDEISPEVYGLIFHPDLIYGTALGKKIGKYSFFSYEPLGGGVFPEDLFHFFQIVDFKFNRFASGSSVVTSDKVFASRFQCFLGFGNFCIDGGRRTYLQVAYVSFYRSPVGVVNFIPDNDTGCGKVGGSSFVEVKLYIIPRLFAAKFNFFCFPGR